MTQPMLLYKILTQNDRWFGGKFAESPDRPPWPVSNPIR